jgi:isopenicillin N synthase-like dioxygenase
MESVPVIDITALGKDVAVARALDDACTQWGFFQIVGHGVATNLLDGMLEQMRAFFALPSPAKQAIVRTEANAWGFYDRELTKNTRDWKEIFDYGPAEVEGPLAGSEPQWPEGMPEFKATMLEFYGACESVALRLVQAIARNLGAEPERLLNAFVPRHTSFLRLNYYPLCDDPAEPSSVATPTSGHLGINHHTDAGAVTVLLQDDQPGLQVFRNGRWYTIEPRANAFVINIGDIVQVWSNDRYRAPLHRVLASAESARYSAPFFFNPSYETDYAPLPSVVSENDPSHYRPINWGEFRAGRAAGDYADYGEEIQISQFAVRP